MSDKLKASKHCAGSVCVACNNVLPGDRAPIRGYASGEELGLCGACAAWVNTPEAIDRAQKGDEGFKSKGPISSYVPLRDEIDVAAILGYSPVTKEVV